jgi:predicted amidohydrolase
MPSHQSQVLVPREAAGADRHSRMRASCIRVLVAMTIGVVLSAAACAAAQPGPPAPSPPPPRTSGLPRKVTLGTVISGYAVFSESLEARLSRMDRLVDEMTEKAPGGRVDLALLPEGFLGRPGAAMRDMSVGLDEVLPRVSGCAKKNGCYLVVPLYLADTYPTVHYSNAAMLMDRAGRLVGIYRKVHPVAPQGCNVLENGTTPGGDFPVFECDFGRIGIQICFDMLYPDGWEALARQQAEIVALPSASPETAYPAMYALLHRYYVVSASPRDHAAVFNPLGVTEAQITQESVLVHQIDLSYAVLHWEAQLEEGEALRRKYGDRVGFHYYRPEDGGIFWSNDPQTPIAEMIASLGLVESGPNVERVRRLQDAARGGPPAMP